MRNVLTLVALLLSSTGIFVSLAREELRCRLGLSSTECVATEQPANPNQEATITGDRHVNAQQKGLNTAQPDPKSPIPSTAKLMETVDQLRDSVMPKSDPENPSQETTTTAPIAPAAPAQTDSTSQDLPPSAPNIPLTSKENAVDAAIIGEPAPPKTLPDVAPIAPPAAKNPNNANEIPVVPAQGIAIPVTPPDQE